MNSYAQWATHALDEDIPLIRELMMYDAACPVCNLIERDKDNNFERRLVPSPLHWSRQVEYPWALKQVYFHPMDCCLDVGSAWSVLKYAIANRCQNITVLEFNEEYINKTQPCIDHLRYIFREDLNIYQIKGDARCMPFKDDTYDHVFCISTIEHIPDNQLQAVRECIRVLKPGGKLVLTLDVNYGKVNQYQDFFLHLNDLPPLLQLLGINKIDNKPKDPIIAAQISQDVFLAVLLICYQKEN